MTVNKLQLPAKNNAVQLKINEIIDNLGSSGGANTDLSNLTATGEAHFLKNTSSYNYALGILGAANADGATSIGYGSVTGPDCIALGKNAKANGTYAIQIGEGINNTSNSLYFGFENNNYQLLDGSTGLIPDARISTNIEKTSNKVTSISSSSTNTQYPSAKLLYDQLALKQNTSTAVTHTANTAVGNSTTPVYIASNGTATSTGLSIASSRFDGQWVAKYLDVASNTAINSYTHSLSTYLPNDSQAYEIFVRMGCRTLSSSSGGSGNFVVGTVSSPGTNGNSGYSITLKVAINSTQARSAIILPIASNVRNFYSQISGHRMDDTFIALCGYRRIGTNA